MLVEIHDYLDIETSAVIRRRFEPTHDIAAIRSIDDIEKARTYRYRELEGLDLEIRKDLLLEGRPAIMEWFFMTPRDEAGVAES